MKFSNVQDLWFDAMVIDGDIVWVFSNNYNALFTINIVNGDIKYVTSVPNEDILGKGLYFNMIKQDDTLIMIPAYADRIAFYNIKTEEFRFICIDVPKPKFFGAALVENCLCLVGNESSNIVSIDTESLQYSIHNDCVEHFSKMSVFNKSMSFRKNNCVVDNKMYIASCITNEIVTFDFITKEIDFIPIECEFNGFRNIAYDGREFWISSWECGELIKYNIKEDKTKIIKICDSSLNTSDIVINNQVWIFPLSESHIYIYDDETKKTETLNYGDSNDDNIHPWKQFYVTSKECNGYIYSFFGKGFELLRIDMNSKKIDSMKLDIKDEYIKKFWSNNALVLDEDYKGLNWFIDVI